MNTVRQVPSDWAVKRAASIWTLPSTRNKVLDIELVTEFALLLDEAKLEKREAVREARRSLCRPTWQVALIDLILLGIVVVVLQFYTKKSYQDCLEIGLVGMVVLNWASRRNLYL